MGFEGMVKELQSSLECFPPPMPSSTVQEGMIRMIRWRNRAVCHSPLSKWSSILLAEAALPFLIVAAAVETLAFEMLALLSFPLSCCVSKPFHYCFARCFGAGSAIVMGAKALVYGNLFCKRTAAESFAGWKNRGIWYQNPDHPQEMIFEFGIMADFSKI